MEGRLGGAVGWVSDWFQFMSWSQGYGIEPYVRIWILCLSFCPFPLHLFSPSVSKIHKNIASGDLYVTISKTNYYHEDYIKQTQMAAFV